MKNKFFVSFLLISLSILFSSCGIEKGEGFQTFDNYINDNTLIRVNAYHEKGGFGPVKGAFYVFESVNKNQNSKDEILTFRHDDPIKIPTQNITIKDENTAYFWMGWKIAVTNDGGKTWSIWDASDYDEFDINYGLIEKVEIEEGGKGEILFNELGKERQKIPYLLTNDFGKTWQKP